VVAILTGSRVRVKLLLYLWIVFYSAMELSAIMKDKLNAGDNVVAVINSHLLNLYIHNKCLHYLAPRRCTVARLVTQGSPIISLG